jgi:C1A family cysteine protease
MKIPMILLLLALTAMILAGGSLTIVPATTTIAPTTGSLVDHIFEPYQGSLFHNFTLLTSSGRAGNQSLVHIPVSSASGSITNGLTDRQNHSAGTISINPTRLAGAQRIILAPFSDDYQKWSVQPSAWNHHADTPGHGLGLIPSPVNFYTSAVPESTGINQVSSDGIISVANTTVGSVSGISQSGAVVSGGLSISYDLRTQGRLTPVKDQGQDGNCWAFAAIGSLESSLLPGTSTDLSENNMKNTAGFDTGPNDGGNDFMASAYLAR